MWWLLDSYELSAVEGAPEWDREEVPSWCCDHKLQSTSIVSPPFEDQVKARSNKRNQSFGKFAQMWLIMGYVHSHIKLGVSNFCKSQTNKRIFIRSYVQISNFCSWREGKPFWFRTEVWAHILFMGEEEGIGRPFGHHAEYTWAWLSEPTDHL